MITYYPMTSILHTHRSKHKQIAPGTNILKCLLTRLYDDTACLSGIFFVSLFKMIKTTPFLISSFCLSLKLSFWLLIYAHSVSLFKPVATRWTPAIAGAPCADSLQTIPDLILSGLWAFRPLYRTCKGRHIRCGHRRGSPSSRSHPSGAEGCKRHRG